MKEKNNNSQRFKKNAITGLIVSLLILIAVNILSSFFFFRIDFTKDKIISSIEKEIYEFPMIKMYYTIPNSSFINRD